MSWAEDVKALREGGYSDLDIETERQTQAQTLVDGGYNDDEINAHFAPPEPDMSHVREFAKKQYNPETADTIAEAAIAGWQSSVAGLVYSGERPGMVLPEDADMFMRIASMVPQVAGDFPAMVAGAFGGGTVGGAAGGVLGTAALPVVGTVSGAAVGAVVGAGAGANALPAAIREGLMQSYEKGDIQDFGDFWARTSAIMIETGKAGVIGGLSSGLGPLGGKLVGKAAPAIARTTSIATEIATAATVGRAMEGEVPRLSDFTDGAVLIAGIAGATRVAGKARTLYGKTGMRPHELVEAHAKHPTLKQDMLSEGNEIPEVLESLKDPSIQEPVRINGELTQNLNSALGEMAEPSTVKIAPLPKELTPNEVVGERIVSGDKAESSAPLKERVQETYDSFYKNFVDDLDPVKRFRDVLTGKAPISDLSDPYKLSRIFRNVTGKAARMIDETGPMDFNTKRPTGTPSLKKIFEPHASDMNGLNEFAVASRAIELEGRGIKTGVDLDAAKKVATEGEAKYRNTMNQMVQFQNDILTYLKDSGVLSDEALNKMVLENKDYVPFRREMDEGGTSRTGIRGSAKNPIKSIEGSERKIISPIETMMKNTMDYIQIADKNNILAKMVDLAESNAEIGKTLVEKQKPPMKAIEITAKEAGEGLVKLGASGDETAQLLLEHGIDPDSDAFTIFRPGQTILGPDEIQVFRNGKREVYKLDPEVREAVALLDRETAPLFFKLMAMPASTLRAGSTLSPDFMGRNLIRDLMTAFNLAEGAFSPIDTVKGMAGLFKKDNDFQNWLNNGGGDATMVSIDTEYVKTSFFDLSKQTGLIDRTLNVIKNPAQLPKVLYETSLLPIKGLRKVSELVENSNRLGEYKRIAGGSNDPETIAKGVFAAREVTLDFARRGAKTQSVNMIIAFWNASVQGIDKTARAFKERPIQTTAKVTASITAPTIMLWYANKDDSRYKTAPQWQKDVFWLVPTDKWEKPEAGEQWEAMAPDLKRQLDDGSWEVNHGTIYRIPKPQELGLIFGTLPERLLDRYYSDNPNAFDGFGGEIFSAFTPSILPTAAIPILDHYANKSSFTGAPIIPAHLEKIAPEYQLTEYTSETAKILGEFVATVPGQKDSFMASPIQLENYWRGWTGGLGQYALATADKLLIKTGVVPDPIKPEDTLADIPFVKAFVVRYPTRSSQPMIEFRKNVEKFGKSQATIKFLAKQGNVEDMEKELEYAEDNDLQMNLTGMMEAITAQGSMARKIYINPDMTPKEKRQQIDGLYYGMTELAIQGNQMIKDAKKKPQDKQVEN